MGATSDSDTAAGEDSAATAEEIRTGFAVARFNRISCLVFVFFAILDFQFVFVLRWIQ